MNAYLYCDKRSINDATTFYVDIVNTALKRIGYNVFTTHNLKDLKDANVIFTITARYYFFAKLRYPSKRTIFWAQGVAAEEAKMYGAPMTSIIFRSIAERIAVQSSNLLLMVSHEMKRFYESKYGTILSNKSFIMPCFNKNLSFNNDQTRYCNPTFVYAGSASVWQAVDQILDVYVQIERNLPNARLIILSGQKDIFEGKIAERGIKNYSISYVALNELDKELSKYKYGFLLREDHIVNNVATPTKMNTYLANHLIPVFSDAVCDFKENINLGEFTLMMEAPLNPLIISERILSFERKTHNYGDYNKYLKNIFSSFYNRSKYEIELSAILSKLNF